MEESPKTEIKKICQYCHSYIKSKEDMLLCPKCSSAYHIDCWYENEGCAAYGCNYRISVDTKKSVRHFSISDALVDAEYCINCRRFNDALSLCRQVLTADPQNIEAKKFYNKIVSSLSAKIILMQKGDKAFDLGELNDAKIYYEEALTYTDDIETELVRSKIRIVGERYHAYLRRKRNRKTAINIVLISIVLALAMLVYYTLFLKEEREFNEISRYSSGDNNIETMENQVSKYEQFLIKFKDGSLYPKAKQKINSLSTALAAAYMPLDLRSAMKFYTKIDTSYGSTGYAELTGKISERYKSVINDLFRKAKEYNVKGDYKTAKDYLEKASALADLSPQFSSDNYKSRVISAINLMNRKNTALTKIKSINDEIKTKTDDINELMKISSDKIFTFSIQIKEVKSKGHYIAEDINTKELIAIKSSASEYENGEYDNIKCVKDGAFRYDKPDGKKVNLEEYVVINQKEGLYYDEIYSKSQREMLAERISYLRMQKSALDSILKINF